jgi:MazG family protein
MEKLLALMARLRDPESGCPWDREQTWETIVPHTLEEAYEVADAIARGDREELKNELGDLLFQVAFYSQIAQEEGAFTFSDVVAGITEKMIRRHPHVFGDAEYRTAAEQSVAWEHIKTAERGERRDSVLAGVPLALPALTRALKLQRKAARVGFDWPEAPPVVDKIQEELEEIRTELTAGADAARLREEIGDILFACVNLARHWRIDPEGALRGANRKFETRFRRIESWLAEAGRRPEQASLAEMDALWERAKAEEQSVEKEKKEAQGE